VSDKPSTSAQAAAPTKSRSNALAVVVLVLGVLAIIQAPCALAQWVVAFIAADQSTLQVIVIVSITLAWPLVTIILGHVALARGKARGESQSNKSLAMAGVILAYICVACWVLIFTYLLYLSVTGTHLRM
jgi:hypothetical protein